MWAKDKLSEIQMVKRMSTRASSNNCLHWWGEKFASLNKILPVHHGCNPNGQEYSHKLKIRTASSKNRKMNFRLEIKRTVNSSWFWLCEPQINNLKSKWSREWGQGQVPTTAFIDGERILLPWIKYCQCTLAAIQMNKKIRLKLKIRTAFSKNRKMNLRLEINSSWFQLCEPKWNNLKVKWSRNFAQGQVPSLMGSEICFLK